MSAGLSPWSVDSVPTLAVPSPVRLTALAFTPLSIAFSHCACGSIRGVGRSTQVEDKRSTRFSHAARDQGTCGGFFPAIDLVNRLEARARTGPSGPSGHLSLGSAVAIGAGSHTAIRVHRLGQSPARGL